MPREPNENRWTEATTAFHADRLVRPVWPICLAWLTCLGTPLAAQATPAERPISVGQRATRLVRLLELPSRRDASACEILKLGRDAVPALTMAMRDPRPSVVGRVAIFLRMLGDDAVTAVPTLREVAESRDPELARAARWALSAFQPVGVTLVADYSGNRLVEFDEDGKTIHEINNLKGIFDAERLPNGNYLIAMAGQQRVREIDRKGKVVWEFHQKSMNPLGATRLPNDHTLIANTGGEILEVDTKGQVTWKAAGFTPWKVQPLHNGNFLIADGNVAVEVDRKGVRVRPYEGARQVHEARRLRNGHTLLASHSDKSVIELDEAGKEVRKIRVGSPVDSARRTPDGATIVGGQGFVRKYDAEGRLLWSRKVGRAGAVRYY